MAIKFIIENPKEKEDVIVARLEIWGDKQQGNLKLYFNNEEVASFANTNGALVTLNKKYAGGYRR